MNFATGKNGVQSSLDSAPVDSGVLTNWLQPLVLLLLHGNAIKPPFLAHSKTTMFKIILQKHVNTVRKNLEKEWYFEINAI